jgi:C-terminal processing protease CtpA/Prc
VQRRTVSTPTPDGGLGGNFGFARAEMLESNIGYIELMGFSGDEASKTAADAAMMSIEGADAVILDLRQNGGGAPFMVRYLSGFFFPEPTHLASTMMRGMDEPAERWTLHDGMPTRAFTDTPLYVLTSRRTFSAAESFTFGLKVNDRITQVGERTGGGGHFGEMVAVSEDLAMFLPRGRTYDPETGLGWEAEGIKPEIEVPAGEALEAAIEAIRG